MNIDEVKRYYNGRYKAILKALENSKFSDFEINKECYGFLEISFKMNNIKYKINHGISNKFPYNLWCKKAYEESKSHRFKSMKDLSNFINKL